MIASDIISVIGHFRDTGEMERFATEWIEFAKSVKPTRDEIALRFAVAEYGADPAPEDLRDEYPTECIVNAYRMADAFIAKRDGAK